jgi:hypothetical protein
MLLLAQTSRTQCCHYVKWHIFELAIITGSTPFLTFYKFRDNMILEELTLGPNTLVPSSQPFYSNNTLAPPPLAQFHLVMVARVKDRVVIVAATVARVVEATTAVATTTLRPRQPGSRHQGSGQRA